VIGFYLSADNTLIPHQDPLIGSQTIRNGLAPGQRLTLWSTVYVPPEFASGHQYLGAVADLTKRVPETIESNNTMTAAIRKRATATVNDSCSIQQAFDFKRDVQSCVGLVTGLTIGAITLPSDLRAIPSPLDPTTPLAAVGVISNVMVGTKTGSPIYLTFVISEPNQRTITNMLNSGMTNTQVSIAMTIYSYDPAAKTYYPSLYMLNTSLRGLIDTDGSQLVLSVDPQPYSAVTQPTVYMTHLGVTPVGCQRIGMASSPNSPYTLPWGCPAP
jgi:hypothetical protein